MNDLKSIYLKNTFYTICTFCIALILPYSRNNGITGYLLILLAILMYIYIGKLLYRVIQRINQKEATIHELKFLFVTLSVLCAGVYFFIGVTDSNESMISGLREVKQDSSYHFHTLDGFYLYLKDVTLTYLNSLYYSIAVMSTLGDSSVTIQGGFTRVVVAFEVGTALLITLFKIGEYYSEQSSKELQNSEDKILNEIKKRYANHTTDQKVDFSNKESKPTDTETQSKTDPTFEPDSSNKTE